MHSNSKPPKSQTRQTKPAHNPGNQANLRKGRFSVKGAVYFLTICTEQRIPILAQEPVARILFSSLSFLETREDIRLFCAIVMPDHFHTVIQLRSDKPLDKIIHSFKCFTSREINKILNRSGSLWQKQYFEHFIRAEESLWKICTYCLENSVRKGLIEKMEDYPYYYFNPVVIDEGK